MAFRAATLRMMPVTRHTSKCERGVLSIRDIWRNPVSNERWVYSRGRIPCPRYPWADTAGVVAAPSHPPDRWEVALDAAWASSSRCSPRSWQAHLPHFGVVRARDTLLSERKQRFPPSHRLSRSQEGPAGRCGTLSMTGPISGTLISRRSCQLSPPVLRFSKPLLRLYICWGQKKENEPRETAEGMGQNKEWQRRDCD